MDIIDYDIITSENKMLVFLKMEEFPHVDCKLSYKSLHNIIYKLSEGYCVTDKRGAPLTVRDDMKLCEEFLNEEYNRLYNVKKALKFDVDETQ